MKIKTLLTATVAALALTSFAAAEENTLTFSLTVDAVYKPASAETDNTEKESRFAPVTGGNGGPEARVTGKADYNIKTPLGDHWLLSGANVNLNGSIELTPCTFAPSVAASFTPLPFLVFSAGFYAGTGWNFISMAHGIQSYDTLSLSYTDDKTFTAWYLKPWAQGTFQFDTGALWPGDWHHIQLMYSYQAYYEKYTAAEDKELWTYQAVNDKTNGWSNYQSLILAYAMPLKLSRVGVMFELNGKYNDSDYENLYYNGSFKEISISPLAQFTFTEKDSFSVLATICSRRSYIYYADELESKTSLVYAAREWFFKRVAFSYTHVF